MLNKTYTDAHGDAWRRYPRNAARRMYEAGRTVRMCPVNLDPTDGRNCWEFTNPHRVGNFDHHADSVAGYKRAFDAYRGRYLAYYVCDRPSIHVTRCDRRTTGPDNLRLIVNGRPLDRMRDAAAFERVAALLESGASDVWDLHAVLDPLA